MNKCNVRTFQTGKKVNSTVLIHECVDCGINLGVPQGSIIEPLLWRRDYLS